MSGARDSYDIVADAVREYWKKTYEQDVVAFFYQKYDFENDNAWEWCEEVITHDGSGRLEFLNDFCEGQTCVKEIAIVSLDEVTAFYTQHHFEEGTDK